MTDGLEVSSKGLRFYQEGKLVLSIIVPVSCPELVAELLGGVAVAD